jgi:hypothetical protein
VVVKEYNMTINELVKNIYHVNFEKQKDLCETFMRFQEHFESPEFRGRVFSIREYKAWYRKTSPKGKKTGRFTYNQDWTGFNIPSYILEPFKQGKFNPLSKKEKKFLKEFGNLTGKFYIIGTSGTTDIATLDHEIAHALFYTETEYRKEMQKLVASIPDRQLKKIHSYFSSTGGYHPDVFEDETHAYVAINMDHLEKKHNISCEALWNIHHNMKKIFDRYNKIEMS